MNCLAGVKCLPILIVSCLLSGEPVTGNEGTFKVTGKRELDYESVKKILVRLSESLYTLPDIYFQNVN